jgi:hypothetical protein
MFHSLDTTSRWLPGWAGSWKFKCVPKGYILDRVAIEGVEQADRIPGWRTFQHYWEKNFPKMGIPKSGQDIFDKCYVFANQIRCRQRNTGR